MVQLTFSFRIPQDLPSEEWLPVVGYEAYYEVSNLGRVRTLKKRKGVQAGYILGKHQIPQGYCYVKLSLYGQPKNHFVHRLVMMAFNPIGNHEDMDVNHKNRQRDDNVLENLEWLTHAENVAYSRDITRSQRKSHPPKIKPLKGLPRGEMHKKAKLTEVDVREIKRLCDQGESQKVVAKRYSVRPSLISMIVNKKRWAHIE